MRRNAIYDTGGSPGYDASIGISAYADVIDNTVAGVFSIGTTTFPSGILLFGNGSEARGNQVRGLVVAGSGYASGIYAVSSGITIADNRVSAVAGTAGSGIAGNSFDTLCTGNTVVHFANAYGSCDASVDNLSLP